MNKKTYTTKEIAELMGVHSNTVRLYEEWGYIARAKRKSNNYRVFTDKHLWQMRLARRALPGPYPIEGKVVQKLVKAFAMDNFDEAASLAREYLEGVELEIERASQALKILDNWFDKKTGDRDKYILKTRKSVARKLGLTIDTLRTWERNGLYSIKKNTKGVMVFSEWDIEKIKIIRLLRNCGYSIASLLWVFSEEENLKAKPSVILSLNHSNSDFYYVTDMFIKFLDEHKERAQAIISLIEKTINP